VFPAGANLSVLLPLAPAEIFVRTFERGAGLTASCGSGMAASRAVYSRPGRIDPERGVLIRNAGGMATASLRVNRGQWCPVLEGNATFVYRAAVDPAALARGRPASGERELYPDEIRAYAALDEQNAARLRAAGIKTAALETAALETPALETPALETPALETAAPEPAALKKAGQKPLTRSVDQHSLSGKGIRD
jgi:diaminopimelate epimerase